MNRATAIPTRRPRAREAGFTLIEMVVAFVLLGLVLSTAFQIFSEGMSRAGTLEERSDALDIARSHLADAGLEQPLQEGVDAGDGANPRYHWTRTITAYDVAQDAANQPSSAYRLFRIEVRVDWRGEDGKDRALSLATLGLGSRA